MPRLPAVCPACEIVYPSPLRAERPDGDNAFAVPAPCPDCGSGGRVPPEVLRRLTEVVDVLPGLGLDRVELHEALEATAEVCRGADSREDAVLGVLRRVPRVGRLAGLLPGETPAQMAVFTRVVRALAEELEAGGVAATVDDAGPSGDVGEQAAADPPVEASDAEDRTLAVAARALERLYERDAPDATGPPDGEDRARRRLRDTGRNDPCPCGSGDKYKACHWVEDQRVTRDGGSEPTP